MKRIFPFAKTLKDENGAVTIEVALWLPFFVILMSMVADVALIFHGQARALDVAQDANRAYAVGQLADNAATEKFVTSAMARISPNAAANTKVSQGLITTVVTMPATDLAAIGFFSGLIRFEMQVTSQQVMEG